MFTALYASIRMFKRTLLGANVKSVKCECVNICCISWRPERGDKSKLVNRALQGLMTQMREQFFPSSAEETIL